MIQVAGNLGRILAGSCRMPSKGSSKHGPHLFPRPFQEVAPLDVLLVNPPSDFRPVTGEEGSREHLGLGYLAATLRQAGFTVEILDAYFGGYSVRQTAREILKRQFRVLGISVFQAAARKTFKLLKYLRRGGLKAHITLGGHFPTLKDREIMDYAPEVDSIVRGEGEHTLLELVRALSDGGALSGILGLTYRQGSEIVRNDSRPLIRDLDSLPFPARDTLNVQKWGPRAMVAASRGCYAACSFCSIRSFYKSSAGPTWRGRSPENVVDEVEWLHKTYGVTSISFADDDFFGPGRAGKERARRIGEEILQRGLMIEFHISLRANDVEEELLAFLKSSGLRGVFLGLESGIQSDLDFYAKGVTVEDNVRALKVMRNLGLDVKVGFILLNPTSRFDEVIRNLEFLKEHDLRNVVPNELMVLAGTPVEQHLESQGSLSGPFWRRTYKYSSLELTLLARVFRLGRHARSLGLTISHIFRDRFS